MRPLEVADACKVQTSLWALFMVRSQSCFCAYVKFIMRLSRTNIKQCPNECRYEKMILIQYVGRSCGFALFDDSNTYFINHKSII